MKTLLTSTALVAMMTTVAVADQTGTTEWRGDTDHLNPGCYFASNTNGVMEYAESESNGVITGVWTTTTAANVKIVVRQDIANPDNNTTGISVVPAKRDGTPGEEVIGTFGDPIPADVVYTSPLGGVSAPTNWTQGQSTNKRIAVNAYQGLTGVSGLVDIDVAGTATITAQSGSTNNDLPNAKSDYAVRHLITCFNNGTGSIPAYTAPTP